MKPISYETKSPLPYIYFEYPENWEVNQITGKGYKEIMILGPRNIEDTFNIAMVVRFTPLSQDNCKLNLVSENYLGRRRKLPGFSLISRFDTTLGGIEVEIIEIGFLSPKSFETYKPDLMEIIEKRVLAIYDGILLEIIFTGTVNDYRNFSGGIEKILESTRFSPIQ